MIVDDHEVLGEDLDDETRTAVARAHDWLKIWADSQRSGFAEIRALGFPCVASSANLAATNFMVSDGDSGDYYDRFVASQIGLIDAAMDDLAAGPHWAWWAICRRHGLGHGGAWRYERLAPRGVLPAGLYTSALVELVPLLQRRGVV